MSRPCVISGEEALLRCGGANLFNFRGEVLDFCAENVLTFTLRFNGDFGVVLFFAFRTGNFRRRLGGENAFLNKAASFLRNAMSPAELFFKG